MFPKFPSFTFSYLPEEPLSDSGSSLIIIHSGGTWGEEDDGNDQSSVWNTPAGSNAPGPANPPQNANAGNMGGNMQWGMNSGPQQQPQREPPNNPMWGGAAPSKPSH